jgi:hypothetical protein
LDEKINISVTMRQLLLHGCRALSLNESLQALNPSNTSGSATDGYSGSLYVTFNYGDIFSGLAESATSVHSFPNLFNNALSSP